MDLRARVGRAALFVLLGVLLAGVTASPAVGEDRGKSGLPSGHGNPLARLQQEIDALKQQLAALAQLGQSVSALAQQLTSLQQQVTALGGLQGQVNTLNSQVASLNSTLNSQVASLNSQIVDVNARLRSAGPSNALGVYDAHGLKIGDVVGVQDDIPWVSLTATGHLVALRVFSGQLIGGSVWFSGANCSGTSYIADPAIFNGADVFSLSAVREPGGVIYAAEAKAPVQQVQVQSVAQHNGTCFSFSSPVGNNLVPASPVMTLDLQFSRPYSVH